MLDDKGRVIRPQPDDRPCMRCGETFNSPDPLNIQRCKACKRGASGIEEGVPNYDDILVNVKAENRRLTRINPANGKWAWPSGGHLDFGFDDDAAVIARQTQYARSEAE